jgi:hypothetical protein
MHVHVHIPSLLLYCLIWQGAKSADIGRVKSVNKYYGRKYVEQLGGRSGDNMYRRSGIAWQVR